MYFCRTYVQYVYFEALSGSYKSECLGRIVDLGTSVLIGFADVTTTWYPPLIRPSHFYIGGGWQAWVYFKWDRDGRFMFFMCSSLAALLAAW